MGPLWENQREYPLVRNWIDVLFEHFLECILKKLKCPREKIHVGGGKGFQTYGFNFKNTKLTEEEDFNRRCHFIKNKASNKALDVLQSLSEKYVKDYLGEI